MSKIQTVPRPTGTAWIVWAVVFAAWALYGLITTALYPGVGGIIGVLLTAALAAWLLITGLNKRKAHAQDPTMEVELVQTKPVKLGIVGAAVAVAGMVATILLPPYGILLLIAGVGLIITAAVRDARAKRQA